MSSSAPRFESPDVDPSALGQPLQFTFSGRSAPNRFMKGAMSERLASFSLQDVTSRGIPSPALIQAYQGWGEGQVGINLTGNVMIDPGHLEAAGNPVIPRDAEFSGERFERFQQLAAAGKANGMLIIAQVGHPGRQTPQHLQPNPISASDVQVKGEPMGMKFAKPRAATEEDIANIIDGFAHAAEYLEKAGFDGIQLHGAHGYLLSQFLSPTTNLRSDKYGGDLKNRMRLILEVRDEIAKRVRKDFVVGIKINSVEFQEKGFQPEEAKELCTALEEHSFDFVELSGGTYENSPMSEHKRPSTVEREAVGSAPAMPDYLFTASAFFSWFTNTGQLFLEFAKIIVPGLTRTKTYVTGGLRTVGGMVKALETVDGVGLGRPLCQEPNLCAHILSGKVKGALVQKINMYDFGATAGASGVQILQMGSHLQPIDLSQEANVAKLFGALGPWAVARQNDLELYEFPAIDGYNTPYSASTLL
jgi:2,4-dienoyl-CoA reductase-like NADH-dependent reductase (Old Yellow Enzyme family)